MATTDKEELEHIYFESGLFGLSAISWHLFRCFDHDMTKSQKRSLYATLASMVKEGLLVTRYEVREVSGNPLPQRVLCWHLMGKLYDDLAFIDHMVKVVAPDRQAQAWERFVSR